MVLTNERPFKTAEAFINDMLDNNIHIIKVGKSIKDALRDKDIRKIIEIDEFLNDLDSQFDYDTSNNTGEELARDYLNSLDDFLTPGQYIKR